MTTKRGPKPKANADGSVDALEYLEWLDGPLTIASLLESERLCEEISHTEMARRLGISKQYLSHLESGRRLASPEQAARFARAIDRANEIVWVGVALEDQLRAAGLGDFRVHLESRAKTKKARSSRRAGATTAKSHPLAAKG